MHPLDKVHCNLWGPAPILYCQQFKYYVSFVDDYTRFCWLFPLKRKSDFFSCFVKFHALVENQFDRKLKVLQIDGGSEFTSMALKNHLSGHGVHQQFACPYTPQQNE